MKVPSFKPDRDLRLYLKSDGRAELRDIKLINMRKILGIGGENEFSDRVDVRVFSFSSTHNRLVLMVRSNSQEVYVSCSGTFLVSCLIYTKNCYVSIYLQDGLFVISDKEEMVKIECLDVDVLEVKDALVR